VASGLVVVGGEMSVGVVLEFKGTEVVVLKAATGVLCAVMFDDGAMVLGAATFWELLVRYEMIVTRTAVFVFVTRIVVVDVTMPPSVGTRKAELTAELKEDRDIAVTIEEAVSVKRVGAVSSLELAGSIMSARIISSIRAIVSSSSIWSNSSTSVKLVGDSVSVPEESLLNMLVSWGHTYFARRLRSGDLISLEVALCRRISSVFLEGIHPPSENGRRDVEKRAERKSLRL
jgi:hypothetical protein